MRALPWIVLGALGCSPSLQLELPALPPEVTVVALVPLDGAPGRLVPRGALDARWLAGSELELVSYAGWTPTLPPGGVEVVRATACGPHALPAPRARHRLSPSGPEALAPEVELVARELPCAPEEDGLVPSPSDGQELSCRALRTAVADCVLAVAPDSTVCVGEDLAWPRWALRLDGSLCAAPLPPCAADPARAEGLVRAASCASGDVTLNVGLARSRQLDVEITVVPVLSDPPPFERPDHPDVTLAREGSSGSLGAVNDFVALGRDRWVVFGPGRLELVSGCDHRRGTELYEVDRRSLAVVSSWHDPRGCLRAPLALADGAVLAGHRTTHSATTAAELWIARFEPGGRVIEARVPSHGGLLDAQPEAPLGDVRVIYEIVETTRPGERARAVAVVQGRVDGHMAMLLHEFDAETLAPLWTWSSPEGVDLRGASRDGDELAIWCDGPDRMELRGLPLASERPTTMLFDGQASSTFTSGLAARHSRLWAVGVINALGIRGGVRFARSAGPRAEVFGALLGRDPLASAFGFATLDGAHYALFTRPGMDRRAYLAALPDEPPAVLLDSVELPIRGAIGRVRTDDEGQLWALVPEQGALVRIRPR